MMRFVVILTSCVLLTTLGTAWADRCIGPKDTSGTATGLGVGIIDPAEIVFCDDFDTYCSSNETAGIAWPGYPPSPDTTLCTDATGGEHWLKLNWTRVFTSPPWGVASGGRMEGWDGNSGWVTSPSYVDDPGNDTCANCSRAKGAGYTTWDLNKVVGSNSSPIARQFPGSNAVNGTDGSPLLLRFWTNDGGGLNVNNRQHCAWNKPPTWPFYGEVYLDTANPVTDRAPTDYTMAALTIPQCVSELVDFPIICQQVNYLGSKPATCPPLSTTVHNSMAFGWLAPMDTDPCDVDAGRRPTMNHAATFDGLYWRELRSNLYPGNGGAFNYGMQQGMFEMAIKSSTYDVTLIAPHSTIPAGFNPQPNCDTGPLPDCSGNPNGLCYEIVTSTATLPRQYTGPFNKIAFGINAGCQLDPAGADGETCLSTSTRSSAPWGYGFSNDVYFDRPVLYGGVGNKGVCCHKDATCTPDVVPGDCTAVGDRFRNALACGDVVCCPYPFADADHDGDVDQDDFGAFQVCYTGAAGGVPTGCSCFDRNSDGNINDLDFVEFNNCWTGSNVPWSAGLTPSCTP